MREFTAGFVSGAIKQASAIGVHEPIPQGEGDSFPPIVTRTPKKSIERLMETMGPRRPSASGAIRRAIVDIEP